MSLPLDISQLDPEVQAEFLECRHTKNVLALAQAEAESVALARQLQGDGLRERKSVDGIGAPIAEISATSFHYWGMREGYGIWHQKDFVREYLRDNPQARVKAKGVKDCQVGYVGSGDGGGAEGEGLNAKSAKTAKFRKSYGTEAGKALVSR